jgi:Tfp pilus assembly protein PilX
MHHRLLRPTARRQRGAAALITVLLLFFVISLVAAYTSRNLIFEQRTASNQYRSTQAMEAAEAGLEWAVGQLNAGRVNGTCTPSTDDTDTTHLSFRQRHLSVDTSSGALTPLLANTTSLEPVRARCVYSASTNSWTCACSLPGQTTNALPAAGTTGVEPAFVVQVQQPSPLPVARPDVVEIQVNSCTRSGSDCLSFTQPRGATGDGVAAVRALATMRSALTSVPAAALSMGGTLAALPSGVTLTLSNQDTGSNGVTLHTAAAAGSLPATGLVRVGLPGVSPANTMVAGDATLNPPAQGDFTLGDRRFALLFGMRPATYARQPGLPTLDCAAGCATSAIDTLLKRNPGRPVWLRGAGLVTIDSSLGSATAPALLIVEGDLALEAGAVVTGLIYQRAKADGTDSTLSLSGNTSVQGAMAVEGNLVVSGSSAGLAVNYAPAVLRQLRVAYGTYVRVPGGWKDF